MRGDPAVGDVIVAVMVVMLEVRKVEAGRRIDSGGECGYCGDVLAVMKAVMAVIVIVVEGDGEGVREGRRGG
ncbi:hypothetical protein E2C01_065116 [Portunus trituberculatus]|uniref:Uncharacterized protein n=1 Tax=Portunus trituberculatus TaxID=210409 RepID=A0A5B7HML4_PORTR|nr:hypothetical protein [Portunus trituberculatus]